MPPLVTVILIATLAGTAGVWLASSAGWSRRLVPFGGGVLIGVGLFWVLPEIAQFFHWWGALLWIAAGTAILAAVDRWIYPVCPACAPSHAHDLCTTRLHGFAGPLLTAAALHSALDGWSLAASSSDATVSLGFLGGVLLHKIPEGLALGVIARAALRSPWTAIAWVGVSQLAMLVGAGLESEVASYLSAQGLHILLAFAGGSFVYLGGHAIHGELRRSGARPAIVPALTGMAGSSVLRMLLR